MSCRREAIRASAKAVGCFDQSKDRAAKKRPHCWGHSSKEVKGRKCQERRCKGPIRQPDRLRVRSRERRVKVKRGLFSCLIEEHFPRQNFHFDVERTASMQVKANTLLTKTFEIHLRGRQSRSRGQNHAHSCTLTAGHYSALRTSRLYSDNRSRL